MANVTIKIRPGDITDTKQADVCVSSIHRSKNMDTGPLASRMKARAGQSVQNELYTANGDRELKHGEIVMTAPGTLAPKFNTLMFVCLYCWKTGNEQTLTKAVKECLQLTTDAGYGTIALPALGMGGQSYPPFQVAKSIITAIIHFIQSNPKTPLRTVFIVLKDADMNSTRTFLQTTVSILAGVQMGRDLDFSGSSVNLEGVTSFHGLENTKPRSLAQEVKTRANQSETQTQAIQPTTGTNNALIRVQPVLSNWRLGVIGEVTLDLKKMLPSVVQNVIGRPSGYQEMPWEVKANGVILTSPSGCDWSTQQMGPARYVQCAYAASIFLPCSLGARWRETFPYVRAKCVFCFGLDCSGSGMHQQIQEIKEFLLPARRKVGKSV